MILINFYILVGRVTLVTVVVTIVIDSEQVSEEFLVKLIRTITAVIPQIKALKSIQNNLNEKTSHDLLLISLA